MALIYPNHTRTSHSWWLRGIKTQFLLYGVLIGFAAGMIFGTFEERWANQSFVESVIRESRFAIEKFEKKNLSLREALGEALGRKKK